MQRGRREYILINLLKHNAFNIFFYFMETKFDTFYCLFTWFYSLTALLFLNFFFIYDQMIIYDVNYSSRILYNVNEDIIYNVYSLDKNVSIMVC